MAQVSEIKASARKRSGTGGARAVRREALVPGVVYGDGREPENVALPSNELVNLINRGRFLSSVIELDVEGKKTVKLSDLKGKPVVLIFGSCT